ncbi:flagellar export chaperone FlgN [Chromobacterium haemolyticum]|uniref:flagellar export chaperone FlgN n=1 Tax=Chromobacterium haemolyticum TaxID=394935 RepID=UPI0009F0C728|nr:flagellar export chaperone FlgN [Chromobacterium haemolyticum]OQS33869.1 hypothetical protein B0T39_20320 [Chromobacterium haemolyticum]
MRKDLLKVMIESLDKDLNHYDAFQALLEQQLSAMQHHDAKMLEESGLQMVALSELLHKQQEKRQVLIRALSGSRENMSLTQYIASLNGRVKEALNQRCVMLKEKAERCKFLSQRNAVISSEQHDLLQDLLNGERHTYA